MLWMHRPGTIRETTGRPRRDELKAAARAIPKQRRPRSAGRRAARVLLCLAAWRSWSIRFRRPKLRRRPTLPVVARHRLLLGGGCGFDDLGVLNNKPLGDIHGSVEVIPELLQEVFGDIRGECPMGALE